MTKYPKGSMQEIAAYSDIHQDSWKGNPFIAALPDNCSDEEFFFQLTADFPFNQGVNWELPNYERIACVDQLYEIFQPWETHIRMARNFASAIRSGYSTRNPLSADFNQSLRSISGNVSAKDPNFSNIIPTNAKAPGFAIIGYSGMGKTSAIEHVLSLYPQKIVHENYSGIDFPFAQITWMKLQCPHDSSVKGLCMEFFQEFDRLMGDNTFLRFAASSRSTTDLMIPQMATLAYRHGLGALVIDEIQNLSIAKTQGAQKMLNFFTQLVNKIGVPVILVGTQAAIAPLSSDLMTARRFSGQNGAIVMDFLNPSEASWEILLTKLWDYQWTKSKAELTSEISRELYIGSHGIVSLIVSLFASAQKEAIYDETEIITPELIRRIVNSDGYLMIKRHLDDLSNPKLSKATDSDFALILEQSRNLPQLQQKQNSRSKQCNSDGLQQALSISQDKECQKRGKSDLPTLTDSFATPGNDF